MAPKDKNKPATKTESTGTEYVCAAPHSEPVIVAGIYKGFIARKVGDKATFKKNPGPCWRPAKDMKKNEEVS